MLKVYWDIELLTVTVNAVPHLTWQWRFFSGLQIDPAFNTEISVPEHCTNRPGPPWPKSSGLHSWTQLHDFQPCPDFPLLIFQNWRGQSGHSCIIRSARPWFTNVGWNPSWSHQEYFIFAEGLWNLYTASHLSWFYALGGTLHQRSPPRVCSIVQ